MNTINVDGKEYPIAPICKITDVQVTIECPYCGAKHFHGRIKTDPEDRGEGHRVSHCLKSVEGDVGYFIENSNGLAIGESL